MKVSKINDSNNNFSGYLLKCPGCDGWHVFDSRWTFNGDFDNPTFTPSMLVKYPYGEEKEQRVCHSFVRDGKWEYLSDCTHSLANQTGPVPEQED